MVKCHTLQGSGVFLHTNVALHFSIAVRHTAIHSEINSFHEASPIVMSIVQTLHVLRCVAVIREPSKFSPGIFKV